MVPLLGADGGDASVGGVTGGVATCFVGLVAGFFAGDESAGGGMVPVCAAAAGSSA